MRSLSTAACFLFVVQVISLVVAEHDACGRRSSSCKTCVSAPEGFCGFCLATKTCSKGSVTGPHKGTCPAGYWEWYMDDCGEDPTPVPTPPPTPSFPPRTPAPPSPPTPAPTMTHAAMCLSNINVTKDKCEDLGCYFDGTWCWPASAKDCSGDGAGCSGGGPNGLYCQCTDPFCEGCAPSSYSPCHPVLGGVLDKDRCLYQGCFWSEEQNWCHESQARTCFLYDKNKTGCDAQKFCHYNTTANRCQGKGEPGPYVPTPSPGPNAASDGECISFYSDSKKCTEGSCYFSYPQNICYPPKAETCHQHLVKATCEGQPWCAWDGSTTSDNGQTCFATLGNYCYQPTTRAACDLSGCYWGEHVNLCFPPNAKQCKVYQTKLTCNEESWVYCHWDEVGNYCYAKTQWHGL